MLTLQLPTGIDENGQISKKRKLNGIGETSGGTKHSNGISNGQWEQGSYSEIKEISFSIPQRKKLTLELGNLPNQGLRATNPSTGESEFQIQWSGVQHIVCLPVPEKTQAQYNFCIFTNSAAEQVLWTVPGGVPKAGIVGSELLAGPEETYKDSLIRALNARLKYRRIKVVEPDEKEFVSQTVQAHRKGEKAVYVKGFRGSKDGTFDLHITFSSFRSLLSVFYVVSWSSVIMHFHSLTRLFAQRLHVMLSACQSVYLYFLPFVCGTCSSIRLATPLTRPLR